MSADIHMQQLSASNEKLHTSLVAQASPVYQEYLPIRIMEVDIAEALPTIERTKSDSGQYYRYANVLVRMQKQPIGIVRVPIHAGTLTPEKLAAQIWQNLNTTINQHLKSMGCAPIKKLNPAGLQSILPTLVTNLEELPFVSIVISTHERAQRLQRCLNSIFRLRYTNYEVIVVDNAPKTQDTHQVVTMLSKEHEKLCYVREDRQGPSHGRNAGAVAAKGDIVVFTDDDVVVDPQWLIQIVRGFSISENVGCVTGLILPLEIETPAQFWLEESGGFSKGYHSRLYDLKVNKPQKDRLFPYTMGSVGSGANMAFRRCVLQETGLFDVVLAGERMIGGEDLMAYFSVLNAGYQLAYEPGAIVYHHHHREYAKLRRQAFNYGAGFAAFLIRMVIKQPWRIVPLLLHLPKGLWYLISANSPKNINKQEDYPNELAWLEYQGLLHGPVRCIANHFYQWYRKYFAQQKSPVSIS